MVRRIREWFLAEMQVAGTVGKLLAALGILWAGHTPSRAEFISSEASLKIAARVAPHEVVNEEEGLHSYELLTGVRDVSAYGWAEMNARGLIMASASGDAIGGQAAFAGQYVKVGGPFLSDGGLWYTGGHVAHRFTTDEEATFHVTMTSDNEHVSWPYEDGSPRPFEAGKIEIYDSRGIRIAPTEWLTPTGGSASKTLSPGEYYITISVPNSGNVFWASGVHAEGFVNASVVWGLNGLPGTTADMPLMPLSDDFNLGPNPKHEPPGWKRATDGGGVRGAAPFEAPVDQATGYGLTDPIYFDPVLAEAFGFAALNDTLFTSFIVPSALPQGDEVFTLIFEGMEYELLAGQLFDLTTLNPEGVDFFMLAGIDSTELIDTDNSHPPFVFGATFAEPGTAEFATFAMVQVVPESTSLMLASLGMGCLSLWGYARQKQSSSSAR